MPYDQIAERGHVAGGSFCVEIGRQPERLGVSDLTSDVKEEGCIMLVVVLEREELADRLTRAIQERTGRMVRGLRVDVQDGQVVLWGLSPSYYYKQLATHAAMEELAGQSVANEIQVL